MQAGIVVGGVVPHKGKINYGDFVLDFREQREAEEANDRRIESNLLRFCRRHPRKTTDG